LKPKVWIAGAVALTILVGGGLLAAKVFLGSSTDEAVQLVPADAGAYVNVFVRPSNSQKIALEDLLGKFPQLGDDFEEAKDALVDLLDPQLAEIGLEFERDIDPWLGNQIALYFMPPEIEAPATDSGELFPTQEPDAAVLVAVTDEDAAQTAIDKVLESEDLEAEPKTYEGTDYSLVPDEGVGVAVGFLEDFMILGSEPALKLSVDAFRGDSLADAAGYEEAFEGLAEDQIATMYFDTEGLVEAGVESSFASSEERAGMETLADTGPIGVGLHVRSDAVVFEASARLPDDPAVLDIVEGLAGEGTESVMTRLPEETWFAWAVPNLGRAIGGIVATAESASPTIGSDELSAAFERGTGLDLNEDVLSWMGSAGLFVEGTIVRDLGGAIVIESSDPDKTHAVVDRIREFVEADGPGAVQDEERGGLTGFSIQAPPPFGSVFVLGGEKAVIAYGEKAVDAAVAPASTLGESERFSSAVFELGDGYEPDLYMDLTVIPKLVDAFSAFGGELDPSYESDVKPALEVLDYAVIGSTREDDRLLQRFVIGVSGGEE
jgi:hypothetical protein